MTTETLNALKSVRDAKTAVISKLTDSPISADEKKVLGSVLITLEDEENILINCTLQDMVDKINTSNNSLQVLILQMDKVSKHLSDISDTIKKVSKMLSVLTEIISKAFSAGLLG
jgi:flagellar hook-basal body complex protein FliE